MRHGQAMLETVIAVFFVTLVFLTLFELSTKTGERIVLDHAAQRAARAKAVGMNDYMCLKTARVAAIPVSGKRLWPLNDENFHVDTAVEKARIPGYLASEYEGEARGILDYEAWDTMSFAFDSENSIAPIASASVVNSDGDVKGRARIESHFPYYMNSFGR